MVATPGKRVTKPVTKKVTSAAQWRTAKRKGVVIDLPSGNTAKVARTLDLTSLVKQGHIPNPLAGIVNKMISTGGALPPGEELSAEAVNQMIDLVNENVAKCMIEPKCVVPPKDAEEGWEPEDEDAISVEEMELSDRMFIFTFAQGAASDLQQFRGGPTAVVAPVPDGEGVPVPAESNT